MKCDCVRHQELLWNHKRDLAVNTTNIAMGHNKEYKSRHKLTWSPELWQNYDQNAVEKGDLFN